MSKNIINDLKYFKFDVLPIQEIKHLVRVGAGNQEKGVREAEIQITMPEEHPDVFIEKKNTWPKAKCLATTISSQVSPKTSQERRSESFVAVQRRHPNAIPIQWDKGIGPKASNG